MKYRRLGKAGLRVSVIGVGTWQFGGEWGKDFEQAEVDAIFAKAAELGVNLIDTAECYGDHLSEQLIGDYLARHDRARWIVATKFGHRFHGFMDRREDFSPASVRQQLEAGQQFRAQVEAYWAACERWADAELAPPAAAPAAGQKGGSARPSRRRRAARSRRSSGPA